MVDISEACDVLAAWDLRVDLDSRGAHVFREFANGGGLRFAVPFDMADPVNTPNTLDTSNPAVLQALARAVQRFRTDGIALDARLGDIQSETRNGEVIPIPGGTGGAGAFNIISARYDWSDGYSDVTVRGELRAGGRVRPRRPVEPGGAGLLQLHRPDLAPLRRSDPLFSQEQMVELDYHEADILADPALEVTRISSRDVLSPEQRFVEAAYADFLGRPPTAAERRTPWWPCWSAGPAAARWWPGWPAPPSGPDVVVSDLYQSDPGAPRRCRRDRLLGRADRPGASCRSPRSRPASTPRPSTSHASGPATSAPGSTTSTPRSWAGPPTPGRRLWIDQVAVRGRAGVALAFVQSRESARRRVDGLYRSLLGRAAEPAGLDFWAPRVVARGDIVLAVDLAAEPRVPDPGPDPLSAGRGPLGRVPVGASRRAGGACTS